MQHKNGRTGQQLYKYINQGKSQWLLGSWTLLGEGYLDVGWGTHGSTAVKSGDTNIKISLWILLMPTVEWHGHNHTVSEPNECRWAYVEKSNSPSPQMDNMDSRLRGLAESKVVKREGASEQKEGGSIPYSLSPLLQSYRPRGPVQAIEQTAIIGGQLEARGLGGQLRARYWRGRGQGIKRGEEVVFNSPCIYPPPNSKVTGRGGHQKQEN